MRGLEVAPLHPRVVSLAQADAEMYKLLVLVDGLRVMRAQGFSEDTESRVICRWRHAGSDLVLDAMPEPDLDPPGV